MITVNHRCIRTWEQDQTHTLELLGKPNHQVAEEHQILVFAVSFELDVPDVKLVSALRVVLLYNFDLVQAAMSKLEDLKTAFEVLFR